jgi:hypothetical protein
MVPKRIVCALILGVRLFGPTNGQEPATPWRNEPLFRRIAAKLDPVPAIDTHTHLLQSGKFDPSLANEGPLLIRSSHPWLSNIVRERFNVTVRSNDWVPAIESIALHARQW